MAAWAAGAAGAAPASKPEPPKAARPAAAAPATAAADETGFAPIFNGKDLSGWTGGTKGYAVESGVLVCPKEGGGNIYTDKDYGDFVLRLDFKLTAGGNNGVGIRVPNGGHAAYDGMEIQILDDTADQYRNLKVWQFCGSIYGVAAAEKGHLRPVGEWNAMEITARGRQVTVKLNGATVVDADLDKASAPKTPDEKAHPGLKNKEGRIAFLGHGSRVEFRNIRVKELKGEAGAK
ncbi:MAG: DUF1080 domain-containing protein [Planctomycetes bacterium]|nr:DUF1080 domain-containing protein [Planctomycetota bacterium]